MTEADQEVLECARYGEPEDLRALLEGGANVNHRDYGGNTALHRGQRLRRKHVPKACAEACMHAARHRPVAACLATVADCCICLSVCLCVGSGCERRDRVPADPARVQRAVHGERQRQHASA